MIDKYYSICNLSYYSLLDSCLSIDDIIKHSIDNNFNYAVLTDKNLIGCFEFYNKCLQNNIRPIIGLISNFKKSEYLFIAKNNKGFKNLIKINSLNQLKNDYDIKDYISDLFVIHLSGNDVIQSSNYFRQNELAIVRTKCKTSQDIIVVNALDAINQEKKLSDFEQVKEETCFFIDNDIAQKLFSTEQLANNKKIIDECHWEIDDKKQNHFAEFSIQGNQTKESLLRAMCIENLKKKVANNGLINKTYLERLDYELDIISSMGYCDYFLVVQDFVNFAKSKNILIGPGRGSSAGSLVAYCLNITEVDPIKHSLIFERFLNKSRKSMPDIDIDVMDERRQELIDYIFDKYGIDNTSYIMTIQRIKAKMAIRDIGRILGVDLKIVDKITKTLTTEQEENLNLCLSDKNFDIYVKEFPLLFELANKLLNIPRQISTHAAGIIIADKPLYEYIPVQLGIDEWHLSGVTMDYLESLGLFKIDILGLKNLSIINDILDLIWVNQKTKVNLDKIPEDDQKVFDDLCQGNTSGIFQLESPGMRSTVMKIKPRTIEDISICSALFRPGPQSLIPDYVKTREKKMEPKYLSDKLKKTFEPTLGFCIYQEQVIELVVTVTNFSLDEADIFRRAISKKNEKLFLEMRKKFVEAAVKNNYTEQKANEIYDFILEFANYGFNHSHSLAYSFISYKMAYLKTYYPLEFYTTLLKHGETTKNELYLSQVKQRGFEIANVSITKSKESFSIDNNKIIFGFSNIKGVGSETVKKILNVTQNEECDNWTDLIGLLNHKGINKKVIEILVKVGAFDEFKIDRNYILTNLDEVLNKALIGKDKQIFDIELSNDYIPMSEEDKSLYEFEFLGYSFSNDEWKIKFNELKDEYNLKLIKQDKSSENLYLVQVKGMKETKTKFDKKMCFINFIEDGQIYKSACFSEKIFSKLNTGGYAIVRLSGLGTERVQITEVVETIS